MVVLGFTSFFLFVTCNETHLQRCLPFDQFLSTKEKIVKISGVILQGGLYRISFPTHMHIVFVEMFLVSYMMTPPHMMATWTSSWNVRNKSVIFVNVDEAVLPAWVHVLPSCSLVTRSGHYWNMLAHTYINSDAYMYRNMLPPVMTAHLRGHVWT